jgi:hypothetical protein
MDVKIEIPFIEGIKYAFNMPHQYGYGTEFQQGQSIGNYIKGAYSSANPPPPGATGPVATAPVVVASEPADYNKWKERTVFLENEVTRLVGLLTSLGTGLTEFKQELKDKEEGITADLAAIREDILRRDNRWGAF